MNWGILFPHLKLFVSFIIFNERVYIWDSKLNSEIANKIEFILLYE